VFLFGHRPYGTTSRHNRGIMHTLFYYGLAPAKNQSRAFARCLWQGSQKDAPS
jgi:hypothetical protein